MGLVSANARQRHAERCYISIGERLTSMLVVAITQFDTKTAAEAARVLDPAELVLGVVIGDQARAYPINMLTGPHREIINDTINRRPIAATW